MGGGAIPAQRCAGRSKRVNKVRFRKLLDLERIELDSFRVHGVFDDYTTADFAQERTALIELKSLVL